jgi:hypothetical protein
MMVAALLGGWGLIILTGLLVQYRHRRGFYKELIYFPKAKKIEYMITFQFGI